MNVAAVGVGGAGGRLLNRLAGRHGIVAGSPITSAIAIGTDRESLAELRSGDAPDSGASSIRVLVVLAGITATRRIQACQSPQGSARASSGG